MEASALHAPVALARRRSTIGLAVLRLRSDEQLVALLRGGHDEAFQVIHDRYRQRLFAYMRQMLPLRQDVEDALQDVFERAYWSLRSGDRELALRPWLYRIAHNRCIDQLRRPAPPPPEAMLQLGAIACDPILEADRREALRRLMADVRRLPEQQRSALLMRELGGISYAELACALGVTVPAVKSLLVRARMALVQATEARDAACDDIRAELVLAHEGRVRPTAMARRHLRDCPGCREFRGHLRGVRRQLLALAPSLGVCGLLARLLGGGGSGGAAGGGAAAACGGSAASGLAGGGASGLVGGGASGLAGGGILSCAGALATSASHVATLLAATVVTAGGAAALQHTVVPVLHPHHAHRAVHVTRAATSGGAPGAPASNATLSGARAAATPPSSGPAASAGAPTVVRAMVTRSAVARHARRVAASRSADDSLAPLPDPAAPAGSLDTSTGAVPGAGPGTVGAIGDTTGSNAPSSGTAGNGGTTPGATGTPSTGSPSGSPGPGSGTTGTGSTGTGSVGSTGTSGTATTGSAGSTPTTSTGMGSTGSASSSGTTQVAA